MKKTAVFIDTNDIRLIRQLVKLIIHAAVAQITYAANTIKDREEIIERIRSYVCNLLEARMTIF